MQVAQLQKILEDEKKVHDILQHALLPHSTRFTLQIPDFVPQEVVFINISRNIQQF